MSIQSICRRLIILSYALILSAHPGWSSDLGMLTLDQLLDLKVISVAKVPEKIMATPAAISIITGEDLRRSGVASIPEALRLVPGVHVYRLDANKWAVSARGFSSRFANKMLVMIDGRTVYSTLFSGVFWDVQDVMLEDVDRIEVIRGPGGSLWGTNAVNGIINIITKDSADTQGTLFSSRFSSRSDGEISGRYGSWLNEKTSFRLYGKYFDRNNFTFANGRDGADAWHATRGGFRLDTNLSTASKLTMQGDLYHGRSGESIRFLSPYPPYRKSAANDTPVAGANLLGRWHRSFSKKSEITLQGYFDYSQRDTFYVNEIANTFDLDFQHRLQLSQGSELLWGLGYRFSRGDAAGKETIPGVYSYRMHPGVRHDNLFSGFVQGRIPLFGFSGELTLGTKLEHNDSTGFEWQPSVRFLYRLTPQYTYWTAITRSVRTPSRIERDAQINAGAYAFPPAQGGLPIFVRLEGDQDIASEKILSYEAGWRGRPTDNLFFDCSLYYNRYDDLVAGRTLGPIFHEYSSPTPRFILPVMLANERSAETYGTELNVNWSVTSWWRLSGSLTLFHLNLLHADDSLDARQGFGEDQNANTLFSLVSYMDLPENLEINSCLYSVSALDGLHIGPHARLDVNVTWHPWQHISLTVGGQNLFDDYHPEFANTMDGVQTTEVPRTLYTRLTFSL